ncbi:hypothetical protein BX600DRAFT_470465 [Xylariales sp. PMI_506]|nr:hypothetical protein BX600DRAFT_470465 [Xylariales sp. PMI_506]
MVPRTKLRSRNGCRECKRRHRRCDESRPSCLNCVESNQRCSYLAMIARKPLIPTKTRPVSPSRSAALARVCPSPITGFSGPLDAISVGAAATAAPPAWPIPREEEPFFNMRHFELLHHFHTQLLHHCRTGIAQGIYIHEYFELAIRQALCAPWLMQQILAISSSHLSYLKGRKEDQSPAEATRLQTRGLSLLNQAGTAQLSTADSLAAYFYSVFVSLQAMYETLSSCAPLPDLVTRLVTWFKLARGMTLFMGRYSGPLPLKMQVDERGGCENSHDNPPRVDGKGACNHFADLMMYLETACPDDCSATACKQAADCLHGLYHNITGPKISHTDKVYFAVKWAILVSPEYIRLVDRQHPGALVVLAHYGALLHHARHYWAVGNSGQFIVASVIKYLGLEGAEVFEWLTETLKSAE